MSAVYGAVMALLPTHIPRQCRFQEVGNEQAEKHVIPAHLNRRIHYDIPFPILIYFNSWLE
jgi:hypothetical protein